MEESSDKPEDGAQKRTPEKRGRVSEFLTTWLRRRHEPLDVMLDDEQKSEKTEKKSNWQRVRESFKGLFRQTVDREYVGDRPVINIENRAEQPAPEPKLEVGVNNDHEDAERISQPSQTSTESSSTKQESSTAETQLDNPIEKQPQSYTMTPVAEQFMAPFRQNAQGQEALPREAPTERVVESPQAAAAVGTLLGAEYIGRHRADRKTRKRLSKTEHNQQKAKQQIEQLKKVAKSTEEEKAEMHTQQQNFEKYTSIYERQNLPEQANQNPAVIKEEIRQTPNINKTIEKMPIAEQVVQQTERSEKPQAVLEKIEVAAEQDIPVEAVYERRHESKEREMDYHSAARGGPTSSQHDAILLAEAIKQRLAAEPAATGNRATPYQQASPQQPDLYKTAVKNGFWAGVVVLIFAVVAFLIIH